MSQYGEIRAALEARLATVVGIPAADHRVDENAVYDAVLTDTWLEGHLQYATETLLTIPAQGGMLQKDGTWRLLVHFPLNAGTTVADDLVQLIVAAFAAGQTIVSGATTVRIDGSRRWTGAPGIRDGFYSVPIDIRWHVWATNTLT